MGEPALPEISGMVSDESCCSRMGMPTCTTDEGAASNGIILFRTPTCRTHPRVRLHFLTVSKCLLCECRLEARVGSSRHGNDGCKHSKYFTLHLFRLREVQWSPPLLIKLLKARLFLCAHVQLIVSAPDGRLDFRAQAWRYNNEVLRDWGSIYTRTSYLVRLL